jgi:hypothetical protein
MGHFNQPHGVVTRGGRDSGDLWSLGELLQWPDEADEWVKGLVKFAMKLEMKSSG